MEVSEIRALVEKFREKYRTDTDVTATEVVPEAFGGALVVIRSVVVTDEAAVVPPSRSGRLRGSPGGLHQHRARMAASDLADAAVLGETKPGLTNMRVQPDIAHELLRRGKAADIADGCDGTVRNFVCGAGLTIMP